MTLDKKNNALWAKEGGSMTKDYELDLFRFGEEEEEEEEEDLSLNEDEDEDEDLEEVEAEELKEKVAEKYGIDPEEEAELLDKLVANELDHRTKLSKTIKQKISWREKAKKTSKKTAEPKKTANGKTPLDEESLAKLVDSRVNAVLEVDRLKRLDLPDIVETEVKEIAKIRGISVGEAAKLPYIQNRIEEVKREEQIKNAIPKRNKNSSYKTTIDPSKPLNPSDFDLSSEEGRKAWNDAKAAREAYHSKEK